MDKLKACHVCNNNVRIKTMTLKGDTYYYVICNFCGENLGQLDESESEASKAWNTRKGDK